MGRKPEPDIIRKTIGLHADVWEQVSEYRRANRITTVAQALRTLVEIALDTERRKKGRST